MTTNTDTTSTEADLSAAVRAHHHLAAALYEGLFTNLMVTASTITDTGGTRGWTLRHDPLNAQALRFDWIHGPRPTFVETETAALVQRQVIEVAEVIAITCGYRARRDGTGLYLTPTK